MIKDLIRKAAHRIAAPQTFAPLGDFYSPIVDVAELQRRRDLFVDRNIVPCDIKMDTAKQRALLERLVPHMLALPFKSESVGLRFRYGNDQFDWGEAMTLAAMLIEFKPKRVVEFGCGYSSCVTIDISERYFAGKIDCTFIDPYPALLRKLAGEEPPGCHIVESAAQDIDLSIIDKLEAGDFLFIDSTHVSKAGSDVNFHLFNVLPRLKSGVHIHFHDVFWPFEYPDRWLFEQNRSWNELYLLRAFLMHNSAYEITLFLNYFARHHANEMNAMVPNLGRGSSLWLLKQ